MYYVPANMSYSEWKKTFENNGSKDGLTKVIANAIMQMTFESPELLTKHYEKHKEEFGDITEAEYLEKANQFYSEAVSDDIEQITRSDGSSAKYKFSTNEFLVITKDGNIRTYFKPQKRGVYWEDEHTRNS